MGLVKDDTEPVYAEATCLRALVWIRMGLVVL